MSLHPKSFENTVGAFSLFPTVFSTLLENSLPFSSSLEWLSATSFCLEESKNCRLGNGLTLYNMGICYIS